MNDSNQSENKRLSKLNRTEILRAVVADAESMGLRDKDKIEQLTSRVIERLEHPQPLPGMEDLVPRSRLKQRPTPTRAEIQAIVKAILEAEEPAKAGEAKKETTAPVLPVSEGPASKKKEVKPRLLSRQSLRLRNQ